MAFPVVESVTQFTDTVDRSTYAVTMPATVNSGDLLLMFFCIDEVLPTISTPTGWTLIDSDDNFNASGAGQGALFKKVADGTEGGGTVDVSIGSNSQTAVAQTWRITAYEGTLSAVESSTKVEGSGTSHNPGSLTPSWGADDTLWIAVTLYGDDAVAVTGYPTNYSSNQTHTTAGGTNTGPSVAACSRELNATSEDPGAFTIASSDAYATWTLGIEPASGSTVNTVTKTETVNMVDGSPINA